MGQSSLLILTACGDGGDGTNQDVGARQTVRDVNVAASTNGGTASATYNFGTAAQLIDGDNTTGWISDPGSPVQVTFAAVENIERFRLTRVGASAALGSNADILISLSSDGVNFTASNVSVVSGGIPCTSMTVNSTTMECVMTEHPVRYIRITSRNGKSYEFLEFEAYATK